MSQPAATSGPFQGHVALSGDRRIVVLDVLRAVAVLLVIGRHLTWLPIQIFDPGPLWNILSTLQRGGWVGVDIFFVLSGFLVSGLLFREYQTHRSLRIGRFLLRRGLKIYPAFYTMIFLTLWLGLVPFDFLGLLSELLFLQSYQHYLGKLWLHSWTLAVEEHFYILLALLIWLLIQGARSRGPVTQEEARQLEPFRLIPSLTLVVGTACLIARANLALTEPIELATHFFPTHLRIDSLLFGVCLSYWFHSTPEAAYDFVNTRWRLLLVSGLGCLAIPFVIPLETRFLLSAGLTLIYLGAGALLCALMVAWKRPGPLARAIAWWGGYSYSVYLWHLPFVHWIREHLFVVRFGLKHETWTLLLIAVYFVGAAVLGVVFARLVEFPVLGLRDTVFPSRSRVRRPEESASR